MAMHWTLQQLRIFESVARQRSFTRAAEELHLTQPAVSIQVKRLEDGIGVPLFEQVGKKIFLTHAGEEVHTAARDVIGRLKGLEGAVADMKGVVAGPLQIAAVASANFFIPHLLGRFLDSYPDVQPQLTVTNRNRVIERLAANQGDFVVMGRVPEDLALVAQPFMENLLVPIAAPTHALCGKEHVPLERLTSEHFLMREPGSGTREATERLFTEQGLTVQTYMELGSSEAIKEGVMAGLGVSVVSLGSISLELEAGRLAVLSVQGFPLRRMWYAVHPQGKRLSLTAATFLKFLLRAGGVPPEPQ